MTARADYFEEAAEDLYENAPCGYLSTRLDGTIVRVNRTFESWTGFSREELVGGRRLAELLSRGGQIYYETHLAPLLQMQGTVREIAVEVVRADGSPLPVLLNAMLRRDDDGNPRAIRVTVFDASDRRRYEQELLAAREGEREIARHLQRSLLSGRLPESDGLEIGVGYRPGVRALEVGGDWYDAFWLAPGERVGLVVGDVVGHGIDAAATMGQLRSATRAFASTAPAPGPLLDALDEFAGRHRIGQMATVVCAELELESGRLRHASAGHPPLLIAPPAGEPQAVWEGRSIPLDVHLGPRSVRPQAECRIEPGSLIVLYTDGVIERRGQTIEDGIRRLAAEVTANRDRRPGDLAQAVLAALADPEHRDDACVLVLRYR